jgi:hypothetical protein
MMVMGIGALGGAVLGIVAVALSAGLFVEHTVDAVLLSSTQRARPLFVASAGSLYLFTALAAAVGGGVIALLTVSLGREFEPDEPRFRPTVATVTGAALAAATGYGALRAGLGVGGTITTDFAAGTVTVELSVFRALVVAVVSGASAGIAAAFTADHLARRRLMGFEGEAWPRSAARFVRESITAAGIPVLALMGIFAVVFGLSRVLLAGHGAAPVAAASVIAALILAGAALIAAHPPRRGSD